MRRECFPPSIPGRAKIASSVLIGSARYLLLDLAIGLPARWLMSRTFGAERGTPL
jgi:hypothetical protein